MDETDPWHGHTKPFVCEVHGPQASGCGIGGTIPLCEECIRAAFEKLGVKRLAAR